MSLVQTGKQVICLLYPSRHTLWRTLLMFRIIAIAATVILIIPAFCIVNAQHIVNFKAAVLQFAEGEVFVDGIPIKLQDGVLIQVGKDQRLDTKKGRAELLLPFCTHLRLGENGSVRITGNRLNDMEMTLEGGTILIEIVDAPSDNRVRVRISESVVEMKVAGLYRLDSDSGELRVHSGEAKVVWKNRKVKVKNGWMVRFAAISERKEFETDT
jgi:hypothetical protein